MNKSNSNSNTLNSVNILRVIALLLVFMLHTASKTDSIIPLWNISPLTFMLKTPAWAGVWIFFILSGYVNALSFYKHRYLYNIQGIKEFYVKRIVKTWLPAVIFFISITILIQPEFFVNNYKVLGQFILCTYNGNPGGNGIGATWFVFTLMQLYLVLPLICYIINRIGKKRFGKLFIKIIFAFVLVLGLTMRCYLYSIGANWQFRVYTPSYMNLDLFICGTICAYFISHRPIDVTTKKIKIFKLASIFALLLLIILNMALYYISTDFTIYIYRYLLPSIYLIVISFYLISFEYFVNTTHQVVKQSIAKSLITKAINKFSLISFEFYLFHSIILSKIAPCITINNSIIYHLVLLIMTGTITIVFSVGYSRIFRVSVK